MKNLLKKWGPFAFALLLLFGIVSHRSCLDSRGEVYKYLDVVHWGSP